MAPPLGTLALLGLLGLLGLNGVCGGRTPACSYLGLLTHLNLTTPNALPAAMRPVRDWTTTTLVQVDLLLYGILQVDEKSQTLTSHVWIQMQWTNEFLSWNPSDFCGIDVMCIPRTSQWIPDVGIMEDTSDSGSITHSSVVRLSPEGLVSASTRQRLTSTCLLNLLLFPFDTQHCDFTFISMTSGEKAIILGTMLDEVLLTNISERFMVTQGEWELEKMEINSGSNTSTHKSRLVYTITISRKPMLYVIIFIVPLFYFVLLDVASFFISEARGEKLSFKVTVLLSISVLLLILKDLLPSTETRLPMIAMYCVGVFVLVGISVLEAVLVSFLVDLDGCCSPAEPPDGGREDAQLEADVLNEPDGAEGTPEKGPGPRRRPNDLLQLILQEVKTARQEVRGRGKDERPKPYRRLAEAIDIVFFILYFFTTFAFLMYMIVKWCSHLV